MDVIGDIFGVAIIIACSALLLYFFALWNGIKRADRGRQKVFDARKDAREEEET